MRDFPVSELRLVKLSHTPSFWWATEDLMNNDDPRGAKLIYENWTWTQAWVHPDLAATEAV